MSVGLYADEHIKSAVSEGLRRRGVDILTAQQDGRGQVDDAILLDRALELHRIMVTQDADFLSEAARRQEVGKDFASVAYAHQERVSIVQFIDDLELMSLALSREDHTKKGFYLPL